MSESANIERINIEEKVLVLKPVLHKLDFPKTPLIDSNYIKSEYNNLKLLSNDRKHQNFEKSSEKIHRIEKKAIKFLIKHKNTILCSQLEAYKAIYLESISNLSKRLNLVISNNSSVLDKEFKRLNESKKKVIIFTNQHYKQELEATKKIRFLLVDLMSFNDEILSSVAESRKINLILILDSSFKKKPIEPKLQEIDNFIKAGRPINVKIFTNYLSESKFEFIRKIIQVGDIKTLVNRPLENDYFYSVIKETYYNDIAKKIKTLHQNEFGIIIYNARKSHRDKLCEEFNNIGSPTCCYSNRTGEIYLNNWIHGDFNFLIISSKFLKKIPLNQELKFVLFICLPSSIDRFNKDLISIPKKNSSFNIYFSYKVKNREYNLKKLNKNRGEDDKKKIKLYKVVNFLEERKTCKKILISDYYGYKEIPCQKSCSNCTKYFGNEYKFIEICLSQAAANICSILDEHPYTFIDVLDKISNPKLHHIFIQLLNEMLLKNILYENYNRESEKWELIYNQENQEINLKIWIRRKSIQLDDSKKIHLLNCLAERNSYKTINRHSEKDLKNFVENLRSEDQEFQQIIDRFLLKNWIVFDFNQLPRKRNNPS